jgi:DnaJ-class molecular chaperone
MTIQNFEVYASPEEKYQEFRRLILGEIKKYHPDINGNTPENEHETRRWNKQLEVLDRVWDKWQKDNVK